MAGPSTQSRNRTGPAHVPNEHWSDLSPISSDETENHLSQKRKSSVEPNSGESPVKKQNTGIDDTNLATSDAGDHANIRGSKGKEKAIDEEPVIDAGKIKPVMDKARDNDAVEIDKFANIAVLDAVEAVTGDAENNPVPPSCANIARLFEPNVVERLRKTEVIKEKGHFVNVALANPGDYEIGRGNYFVEKRMKTAAFFMVMGVVTSSDMFHRDGIRSISISVSDRIHHRFMAFIGAVSGMSPVYFRSFKSGMTFSGYAKPKVSEPLQGIGPSSPAKVKRKGPDIRANSSVYATRKAPLVLPYNTPPPVFLATQEGTFGKNLFLGPRETLELEPGSAAMIGFTMLTYNTNPKARIEDRITKAVSLNVQAVILLAEPGHLPAIDSEAPPAEPFRVRGVELYDDNVDAPPGEDSDFKYVELSDEEVL